MLHDLLLVGMGATGSISLISLFFWIQKTWFPKAFARVRGRLTRLTLVPSLSISLFQNQQSPTCGHHSG